MTPDPLELVLSHLTQAIAWADQAGRTVVVSDLLSLKQRLLRDRELEAAVSRFTSPQLAHIESFCCRMPTGRPMEDHE
jgi:hypothetical protein